MTSLAQQSSGKSLTISYYTTGNGTGLISSVASSDGRTVNYGYDSNGHLISVTSYDGQSTNYSYDSSSNAAICNSLTAITPPSGPVTSFTYSAIGQLSAVNVSGGQSQISTTFAYSPYSGQVNVSDAAGNAAQYFFDKSGLLLKTIDPLGNVSSSTYDGNHNILSATGPTNLTATFTYDSHGNLLSSTNAAGQTVTFTYGSLDRVTGMTDAKGNTTAYAYDASGNLVKTTDPGGNAETATYDAQGNPLTLLNPNGQKATYTYNSAGQATKQTLADGSVTTFAYDSRGNLTTAADSTGTTTLTYDSGDRLTKITYSNGRFLAYTYDAAGRRTKMVDQAGFTVNYAYNSLGFLTALTDGTGASIIAYTHNNLGQLTREDKGNGTYTTFQYDADGNLLHLINYSPAGIVQSRFDYTYDTLGQETSMATLDGTWTYGYDAIGQLTTAAFASTNPAIPSQNLAYTYDAAGNRTQTIINGVTTNYTANKLNQYTTVGNTTYQYDKDGNLISSTTGSATTTYTYDSLDRLVGMTTPTDTWTYSYNTLNQRATAAHNGQLTTNLVDPTGLGNVVGTYNSSGNLVANYTYGLGLVNQVASGSKSYYDFDALGSTAALTGPTGTIVNAYRYEPFGGLLNSSGTAANPFIFVGQWGQTSASGLDLMVARAYDPATGRFTSQDPAAADLNLYRYAGNNPVTFVDPSGLWGDAGHGGMPNLYYSNGKPVFDWTLEDDDLSTSPLNPFGGTSRHFRNLPDVEDDLVKAVADHDRTEFERLMHQGQDFFSHYFAGYRAPLGHLWTLEPDNIATHQPEYRMAQYFTSKWLAKWVAVPPPPASGTRDSEIDYNSSGQIIVAAITAPSPSPITATANSTTVQTTFTVTNTGTPQSKLHYLLSSIVSAGGSFTLSGNHRDLDYGQADTYTITATMPAPGFQPGQTYTGTFRVYSDDSRVSAVGVTITVTVPAPTYALTGPTSGTYTVGQSVPIQWTAAKVGSGSTISLCYDTDTIINGNERWIEIDQVAGAEGSGSYSWNTTGVTPGTYYIGGYLYSGGNAYFSHLNTSITISAPDPPVGSWSGYWTNGYGDTFPINYLNITHNANAQTYSGSGSMVIGYYSGGELAWTSNESMTLSNGYYTSATAAFTASVTVIGSTNNLTSNITKSTSGGTTQWTMNGQFTNVGAPPAPFTLTRSSNLAVQPPDGIVAGQLPGGTADTLTQNALAPIVAEAIARWRAAGLPAQDVGRLAGLSVQIVDLPGLALGVALPDEIRIDKDAAGYGWFVDPTPADDAEFAALSSSHSLLARKGAAADQRADLLTAVMHEMGHLLGYDDNSSGDLMGGVLPLGARRLLAGSADHQAEAAAVDHVFALS